MIALVIGSVIVTLAYGTLASGIDVQRRVARVRDDETATALLRSLLTDALRHAVIAADAPVTAVVDGARGTREFSFTTRGLRPPHGGSALWRLTLRADSADIILTAAPVEGSATPIRVTVPGAREMQVRFQGRATGVWMSEWSEVQDPPAAVEVQFRFRDGRAATPPILARTSPVSAI
jgi:hypothetical protein